MSVAKLCAGDSAVDDTSGELSNLLPANNSTRAGDGSVWRTSRW